jgi:hypothetical protein
MSEYIFVKRGDGSLNTTARDRAQRMTPRSRCSGHTVGSKIPSPHLPFGTRRPGRLIWTHKNSASFSGTCPISSEVKGEGEGRVITLLF